MIFSDAIPADAFRSVRQRSVKLCEPLETEDFTAQPCTEVSPPKWHLAHTSWFFEEVILCKYKHDYQRFNPSFSKLFNSYYKSAGVHWLQSERGNLSRPTVSEVLAYRHYIDEQMLALLKKKTDDLSLKQVLELGLHHEQQHQELLLMDIKYILGINPQLPAYTDAPLPKGEKIQPAWFEHPEGIIETGYDGNGFAYDNEKPKHKSYIYPFRLSQNLVSNGEYLEFIEDGGYSNPALWLSKGYDFINENNITQPLYWSRQDDTLFEFTLHGNLPLDPELPVAHISYFEADAYAKWKACRLPTEQEMEVFHQTTIAEQGTTPPSGLFHPNNTHASSDQLWCWTSSHYSAYPGFSPFSGMAEEYNGKFMCNQFVLRGSCIATPPGHWRTSYRNFYEPHQRWMFSGIRLARDDT